MIDTNDNEYMERLVDALMFAFRIQKDDSLVSVLGSGSEKSNQDALRNWIQNSLINPDLQMAESVLPILIARLEQTISLVT